MAPRDVEGSTLGEKHRHYNTLLKQALQDNVQPKTIGLDASDVDNLINIDIACHNKMIDYVLEVLKCEDILYVSRAIKKSPWLVDKQYANFINPQTLFDKLFPQMTSRAICKLMLHIRLHLKDEQRAEEFYKYYEEKDFETALKWLPLCSVSLITKVLETHPTQAFEPSLLKRFCEKSTSTFEAFVKSNPRNCSTSQFSAILPYLKTMPETVMDMIDSINDKYWIPSFNRKYTEMVMKKCPNRFIDKFETYGQRIHLQTFARNFKKENIKSFITTQLKNKKVRSWFNYDILKHFVQYMPKDGRFEFLKKVFIDKDVEGELGGGGVMMDDEITPYFAMACKQRRCEPSSNANVYRWYRFAPFDVAMTDLKKMIRTESRADERNAMLSVLLTCAGRNISNTQTLLQYYYEKHINEPFKYKNQFINNILGKKNVHKFEDKAWKILNNIFYSMEVYIESENNVQPSIEAIIIYKLVHNEKIPDIINKKFSFNTLKSYKNKLNKEEQEKVFTFLFYYLQEKLKKTQHNTEDEFTDSIQVLKNILTLLIDWDKELASYPTIINKIKDFIRIKKENFFKAELKSLYDMKKSWRKLLFEESVTLHASEDVIMNALKHDPQILERYRTQIDALKYNDTVSLTRVLRKLRIYWRHTLAEQWIKEYEGHIKQASGNRATIRALCTMMPRAQLLPILKQYVPEKSEINWSEIDEVVLSVQKNLAMNMHIARPQPQPDAVLCYAKGNYMQYALPSVLAIFYNLSKANSRPYIPKLLDSPVSLQKHGIRIAFRKLPADEVKALCLKIWQSTKNSSIRADLFKLTYNLLRQEKEPAAILRTWELLSEFIDKLTQDENKKIYTLLGETDDVPQEVRAMYCEKSYKFLNSLPEKANCGEVINRVLFCIPKVMEHINIDFVTSILKEFINNKFLKKKLDHNEVYYMLNVMSAFLLSAKDEQNSKQRYDKVLQPLLETAFLKWKERHIKENFGSLLKYLTKNFVEYVVINKNAVPVYMFSEMQNKFESTPVHENYLKLIEIKLLVAWAKIVEENKSLLTDPDMKKVYDDPNTNYGDKTKTWDEITLKLAPKFGESCLQLLAEDTSAYFSSIYVLFTESLWEFICNMELREKFRLIFLQALLKSKEFVQGHLLVIKMLSHYAYEIENIKKLRSALRDHDSLEVRMHYYHTFGDGVDDKDMGPADME